MGTRQICTGVTFIMTFQMPAEYRARFNIYSIYHHLERQYGHWDGQLVPRELEHVAIHVLVAVQHLLLELMHKVY